MLGGAAARKPDPFLSLRTPNVDMIVSTTSESDRTTVPAMGDQFKKPLQQLRKQMSDIKTLQDRMLRLHDSLECGQALFQSQREHADEEAMAQSQLDVHKSYQALQEFDIKKLFPAADFGSQLAAACGQAIGQADDGNPIHESPAKLSSIRSHGDDQLNGHVPFIRPEMPLHSEEYKRYGRQMIMPEVGLQGQLHLRNSKILIIGAGGLGCPAAAYLAGAGIGVLGIVDGDVVETSNLHRQILHSTATVGSLKVDSAIERLKCMSPLIRYVPHAENISSTNALRIVSDYDLVLDCTDRPMTRYLISDVCVILGKQLVSASALRMDGQLSVLNSPAKAPGDASGGPCYRCVWPKPPPADNVMGCAEGGILGPVVGVMGVFMALEAIKLIISGGLNPTSTQTSPQPPPTMLLLSASSPRPVQNIRLQPRRKNCVACSSQATISAETLTSGSLDYVAFCGVRMPLQILPREQRISAARYATQMHQDGVARGLVDVREKVQYDLCHMPGSINIPWSRMENWRESMDVDEYMKELLAQNKDKMTFVCREGNDSQLAVLKMEQMGYQNEAQSKMVDIIGGWQSWRKEVDADWPQY